MTQMTEIEIKQEFAAKLAANLSAWAANASLDTFADILGDTLAEYIDWQGDDWQDAEPDVGLMGSGYCYAEIDEHASAWVGEVFEDLPQPVKYRLEAAGLEIVNSRRNDRDDFDID